MAAGRVDCRRPTTASGKRLSADGYFATCAPPATLAGRNCPGWWTSAVGGQTLAKRYVAHAQAFARRFTDADVLLLARIRQQLGTISDPATAHLLQRAYSTYADARFERLAGASVSHAPLNLRHSYRHCVQHVVHTPKPRHSNE